MKDVNKIVDECMNSDFNIESFVSMIPILCENPLEILKSLKSKVIEKYSKHEHEESIMFFYTQLFDSRIQQLEITTESYEPTKL